MFSKIPLQNISKSCHSLNLDKIRRIFPQLYANIDLLSEIQNHKYKNVQVAATSIIHRSAFVFWPTSKEGILSNERLEFLGDAFLNFFVASYAMENQPQLNEGELSKLRAVIVGTKNLAHKSLELGLARCLLVGRSEIAFIQSPEKKESQNVLADMFESVTAALLIDAGFEKTVEWLTKIFSNDILMTQDYLLKFDAKGKLQQWTQGEFGQPPVYKTLGTEGTPQETLFIVGAFINGIEVGRAVAKNKRDASKKVADVVLESIQSGKLTKEKLTNSF